MSNQTRVVKLTIVLLIEDNDDDVVLTRRIIHAVNPAIDVVVYKLGEEALEYLKKVDDPPQLILLDIGLPKMDGLEFIRQMRTIKKLEPVPVVILTGLAADIAAAHAANVAAGYIIKPIETDEFKALLIKLGLDT